MQRMDQDITTTSSANIVLAPPPKKKQKQTFKWQACSCAQVADPNTCRCTCPNRLQCPPGQYLTHSDVSAGASKSDLTVHVQQNNLADVP